MGQDDWLRVENTTDQRIFVMEKGETDSSLLVLGLEPGESGRAPQDKCDASELVARAGSADGPVLATRDADDGRECVGTWVIGAGD